MAMGKGIIASNLNQIGTLLTHEETAYLVNPGDTRELKGAMRYLFQNKDLAQKMGYNSRQAALEKHTWKKHTERIINKIKFLIQK